MTLDLHCLKSDLRNRLGMHRGDMACRLIDDVASRTAGDRGRVSLPDICAAAGPDIGIEDAFVIMTALTQWDGLSVFRFCLDFVVDGQSQEMTAAEYGRCRSAANIVHLPTGRIVHDIDRHVYPVMRATSELMDAFSKTRGREAA